MNKKISEKKQVYVGITLIILLSIFPLLDLLNSGFPVTHDGKDHVARIASFYANLSQGNIIPRWGADLNWGFGHPVLMFLYPLPSYIASFFHLLGFTLSDSLKLVFATTYITSGIGMYLWTRRFLSESASIVAGALYMFAPYRFVDLYVRGAIGEHVAFMFVPFVLLSISIIWEQKKSEKFSIVPIVGGAVAAAGLILAHNAISLMFMPVIFLYIVFLFYTNKQNIKKTVQSAISILTGFLLSFYFWFPAFFEGKYTLRDIVASEEYQQRFVKIQDLLYGDWSYGITGQFTTQVGVVHIALLIVSLVTIKKIAKSKKYLTMYLGLLAILFASLFIMLEQSDVIWQMVTMLQKFQFPWRFLSVTIFAASVIGAIAVHSQKSQQTKKIIFLLTLGFLIATTHNYWHAKEYSKVPDSFFEKVYEGTTDTGESSPRWATRFAEHKAENAVEIVSGDARISNIEKNYTKRKYVISSKTDQTRIRDNTLYFPGWEVYVNDKKTNIEFQDPANRGIITYLVPKGSNNVRVEFTDTKLRQFANIVSLFTAIVSLLAVLGAIVIKVKKNK